MRRRFIADTWSPQTGHPTHAALTGGQAAHLSRVLRAQPGQIYDIVANGFLHRAEITAIRAPGNEQDHEVAFLLHEELEADAALPMHLLLAIFKFDHFEWAIEKATELGIARVTPILARRTEKHLALAAPKRAERWRRIALEAAQQSRRSDIPEIADPIPLAAAVTRETAPLRILLSETEQSLTLSEALTQATTNLRVHHPSQSHRDGCDLESSAAAIAGRAHTAPDGWNHSESIVLAVGPEGGWAPEEMSLFTTHTWTHVTLGPRILRAETAAIAAIAIASSHFV